MPDHPHISIDEVAAAMRAAYNEHIEPGTRVTPWPQAAEEKRAAWRVCAKAAFKAIFGTEYPS